MSFGFGARLGKQVLLIDSNLMFKKAHHSTYSTHNQNANFKQLRTGSSAGIITLKTTITANNAVANTMKESPEHDTAFHQTQQALARVDYFYDCE